jgi:hypothetical protein
MQIQKADVLYFAVVFRAGFVLGTIRTLWGRPTCRDANAELMLCGSNLVAFRRVGLQSGLQHLL